MHDNRNEATTRSPFGQHVDLKIQSQYGHSAFGVLRKEFQGQRSPMESLRIAGTNLKKQSQFMPDMMGANPFIQGDYGDFPPAGHSENKAKQSQFQGHSGLRTGRDIRCPSDT
jgi:hypothetical protein